MNAPLPPIKHCTYIESAPERVYELISSGPGWDEWFTDGSTVDSDERIVLRWKNFGAGRHTTEDGGPILQASPPRVFSFQWSPSGHPTTVTILLEPLGDGTLVELIEDGYSSSDLEAYMSCATGWGEALTLLKYYAEYGKRYGVVPGPEVSGDGPVCP